MKNKLSFCLIACCAALFAGCLKDDTETAAPLPAEAGVELRLAIDAPAEITTYSAASAKECNISSLYLLVFDAADGTYKAGERIASSGVTGNKTTTPRVTTRLPFKSGDRVVVLVNTGQTFTDIPLTVGSSTVADIDAAFPSGNVFESSGLWKRNDSSQPMCGEVVAISAQELPVCTLYRAFAKIRVNMVKKEDLADPSGEIAGKSFWWELYQVPTRGNIYSPDGRISVPGMSRSMFIRENSLHEVKYDPDYVPPFPVYIPEFDLSTNAMGNPVSSTEFHKDRMCVILTLDFASTLNESKNYYRLDLVEGNKEGEQKKWLDIRRNHSYRILITQVHSRGYLTPEEALANPPANIEYTVTVEDSGWGTVVSNGQYGLKIDCDTCRITTTATAANLLRFVPQMPDAGQGQGSEIPGSVTTCTVRLVDAYKKPNLAGYGVSLCQSDGTPLSTNSFDFSGLTIPDEGYQLKYTADPDVPIFTDLPGYVQFRFGSIYYNVPLHLSHLKVEAPADFDYKGGTGNLRLQSYVVKEGQDFPASWKAEFSTDEGKTWSDTPPSWLSMPTQGTGTSNHLAVDEIPVTVAPQQLRVESPHNKLLKETPSVSNYNLSNATGETAVQNTANCYLVNAPGTYRLPLVYGNAIKNGATNASAYTTTASGYYVLSTFLDHMGSVIVDPKISARYQPQDCCLVWQDAEGLVTNVRLSPNVSSGYRYLEFEVPQATICQGNAVVAVRDAAERIIWSWHIWVTDYKLGTGLDVTINKQNKTYRFLPYNLGWCDEIPAIYPARSVRVRFTQTSTGMQQDVAITQIEGPVSTYISGNSPYFQFGRKDPMPPGLPGNVEKTLYNDKDYYTFNLSGIGPVSLSTAIQNPHVIYNTSGNGSVFKDWCSTRYDNLWSADNVAYTTDEKANDDPVVKTIYDPSPVGFCMPPSNAWTNFASVGTTPNATLTTYYSPKGYIFNITSGTTFYPFTGRRSTLYDGLHNIGTEGTYWSAVASHCLEISSNFYIQPLSGTSKSMAVSVRPVQE